MQRGYNAGKMMTRFFIISLILIAGCDFFSATSAEPPPVQLEETTSQTEPESYLATPRRQRQTASGPSRPDNVNSGRRLALLKEELDAVSIKRVRHLISGTMPEKEMLTHLQEAAHLVDDIYGLQVHGSNLIWRQQTQKSGSDVEKLFIESRYIPADFSQIISFFPG